MNRFKALVWLDRLMIVWCSIWFLSALWDAMQGHLAPAIVGFLVQGFGLWLFFCKFLPRDKARLQSEIDLRSLDKLDW